MNSVTVFTRPVTSEDMNTTHANEACYTPRPIVDHSTAMNPDVYNINSAGLIPSSSETQPVVFLSFSLSSVLASYINIYTHTIILYISAKIDGP